MNETQPRFEFDAGDPLEARDAAARLLAVDPTRNVALEASAGTGKTRVLVDRYVGLLAAGVKPRNILAMTFTRKAAAEMRQRILQELSRRHRDGAVSADLWRELRESLPEISISTIDAFCLALLREFPLEADVDPGFELADETETPQLVDDAVERTLRIARGLAVREAEIALLFAELGEYRLRQGLARLIDRRLVAGEALSRFLRGHSVASVHEAVDRLLSRIRAAFDAAPGGLGGLLASGPVHPEFDLFRHDLGCLLAEPPPSPASTQALLERVREHLLTQEGAPRKRLTFKKSDFRSAADHERHAAATSAVGPYFVHALQAYRRDLNVVLTRAVRQLFVIATDQYEQTLRKRGVLDFPEVLARTLRLLSQMDEFSRSRFRLEARFQHVLVDEFQDTSRAQWELVELLVRSWAAGFGLAERDLAPSIFIVGDRKQSIYGFRDAEVAVLDEAGRFIEALRPAGQVRTAITRSFRSVREVLSFVNDLFIAIDKATDRADAFRYTDDDSFPLASIEVSEASALGLAAASTDEEQADAVADEIATLLAAGATVRDRDTGVRRPAKPGDIAILFRTRDGHRLFEDALARRRVPYYVYKGLGFFDADEIKDVLALLAFLARPESELNAAAFLRSRFVRLSDEALKLLAPRLTSAVTSVQPPAVFDELPVADRQRLALTRRSVAAWLRLADRVPPSELLDRAIADSAYHVETAGPAYRQSRENLKKVRALIRRTENRGYATLARVVDHFAQLVAGGDESNAIVDALDAVNLMTIHAAKGLEFPIVFVVNLQRGSGGSRDPIRVAPSPFGRDDVEPSVAVGDTESEADRDLEAREGEETKRLLYVALTRARDRLYLAASLNDERQFAPWKGGLGRMLPASVAGLITAAGASTDATLTWSGGSASHQFRILRTLPVRAEMPGVSPDARTRRDDFAPMPITAVQRVAATALAARSRLAANGARTADENAWKATAASEAAGDVLTAGVLVHRAIEAGWLADNRYLLLDRLIRLDERALLEDVGPLVEAASAALHRLKARPEVLELFDDSRGMVAWRQHEVPFSLRRADATLVRGSIDCLLQLASGEVRVVEFKTGRASPVHQRQLDIYVEAARALFPDVPVEGIVIHA